MMVIAMKSFNLRRHETGYTIPNWMMAAYTRNEPSLPQKLSAERPNRSLTMVLTRVLAITK